MNPTDDLIVKFDELDWEIPTNGIRQKTLRKDAQQVRLMEFSDEFSEEKWCTSGHIGYVVEGELSVDFNGRLINYTAGDGLWIKPGEKYAHKAMVEKGKKAVLVLFEENLD